MKVKGSAEALRAAEGLVGIKINNKKLKVIEINYSDMCFELALNFVKQYKKYQVFHRGLLVEMWGH